MSLDESRPGEGRVMTVAIRGKLDVRVTSLRSSK